MSDTLTQENVGLGTGDAVGPNPGATGLLLAMPRGKDVWLIMPGGYRALVPGGRTGKTFSNLFLPQATVNEDTDVLDISEEASITDGAVLVNAGGTIYLITGGMAWPVTSGGFSRFQFNSDKVVDIPLVVLNCIPGPAIQWP
ncbi:MAG: hypothetical protein ACJ8GN_28990 [Longimicrobiaceae bacterium]